jgi:hypothetical protein
VAKASTVTELLVAIAEAAGGQTQASSFECTDQSTEMVDPGKCKRLFTSQLKAGRRRAETGLPDRDPLGCWLSRLDASRSAG